MKKLFRIPLLIAALVAFATMAACSEDGGAPTTPGGPRLNGGVLGGFGKDNPPPDSTEINNRSGEGVNETTALCPVGQGTTPTTTCPITAQ